MNYVLGGRHFRPRRTVLVLNEKAIRKDRVLATLAGALVVPLGPKVAEAAEALARQGMLDPNRILAGLPHPRGANAERIAFFLGRKPRAQLSSKVDADKLLRACSALVARIAAWT